MKKVQPSENTRRARRYFALRFLPARFPARFYATDRFSEEDSIARSSAEDVSDI